MAPRLSQTNGSGNTDTGIDNANDDGVLRHDSIRCTILEQDWGKDNNKNNSDGDRSSSLLPPDRSGNAFFRRHGMVIDDACSEMWMSNSVQGTRETLPLDQKRPTVDRRFYCDATRQVICEPLERIVRRALEELCSCLARQGGGSSAMMATTTTSSSSNTSDSSSSSDDNDNGDAPVIVYCNKYLRFLEYNTIGSELLPHRDGIKTCEDTGIKSTHTLLLFLSDCEFGGETLIMDDSNYNTNCNGGSGGNGSNNNNRANTNWSKETNLELAIHVHGEKSDDDGNNDNDGNNGEKEFNKRRIRYCSSNNGDRRSAMKTKVFRLGDATIRSNDDNHDDDCHENRHHTDNIIDPNTHTHAHADAHSTNSKNKTNDAKQLVRVPPPRHVSVGVQPVRGRILIFPHHWAHAGAMCRSVPKIALRAELAIIARQ